jgi:hypothetical protein
VDYVKEFHSPGETEGTMKHFVRMAVNEARFELAVLRICYCYPYINMRRLRIVNSRMRKLRTLRKKRSKRNKLQSGIQFLLASDRTFVKLNVLFVSADSISCKAYDLIL